MGIFGVDSAAGVLRKLLEFQAKETGVLSQCEVQASRNGDALEIKSKFTSTTNLNRQGIQYGKYCSYSKRKLYS